MATSEMPLRDPTTENPPRPRRWIPLSIRLFAGITALMAIGSVAHFAWQRHRHETAVQALRDAGAEVNSSVLAPEMLRRFANDSQFSMFSRARSVRWNRSLQAHDAVCFGHLGSLPSLEELMIGGPGTTDEGLRNLVALVDLKRLHLGCTSISDEGLQSLRNLTRLEFLDISNTAISDQGLEEVCRLTAIRGLDLHNLTVTDSGVQKLCGLLSLMELDIAGTQVTDAGLRQLSGLPSLRRVNVNGSQITQVGIGDFNNLRPAVAILH